MNLNFNLREKIKSTKCRGKWVSSFTQFYFQSQTSKFWEMSGEWLPHIWSMKQWGNVLWVVKEMPASHETETFRINV